MTCPRTTAARSRSRCPTCQVAVYSDYPAGHPVRPRGTLDYLAFAPDVHIFTRSKLPWVTLPASTPAFEVYYHRDAVWKRQSLDRIKALDNAPQPSKSDCYGTGGPAALRDRVGSSGRSLGPGDITLRRGAVSGASFRLLRVAAAGFLHRTEQPA